MKVVTTLLKCNSHRAREKLFSLCNQELAGFYSWSTACTGGFYETPVSFLSDALKITGVTKASKRYEYHKCISWK